MKRFLVYTITIIAVCFPVWAEKRIYIAPDDHTDYFWTAGEDTYRQAFLDTIDYYLNLADNTASESLEHQSRWNCDGSFWMYTYEKNRSATEFQRLIDHIKSGHISVPLNALCVCLGGAPMEAVLRGMYYPGRIERQYGLRFRLAYTMENQTQPLGLATLWAGSGARYSWKGICNCDTRVNQADDREHDIYWYTGPDGSRILMKWNSLIDQDPTVTFANQSIGGYAEAHNPSGVVDLVDSNPVFQAKFPYNIIGAFGYGWDGLQTMTDIFVTVAKSKTNSNRTVFVSNEQDFFEDFEAVYGSVIPAVTVTFGNEWDLYVAAMAEVAARAKRSVEKLRTAEALAALVSLNDAAFMNGREDEREQAWMDLGLFWEHNWGMVFPPSGLINERIAWQKRLAGEIESYVNGLLNDATQALGGMIPSGSSNPRFYVFNPLGWTRSDVADFVYSGTSPVHVVDLSTGLETPSQMRTLNGIQRLRIWATDVPSIGYKVFEIRAGVGAGFPDAATVSGTTIENQFYRLVLESNGAISSLVDKQNGNREFARNISGQTLNDLGPGTASWSVENTGPVSTTMRIDVPGTPPHTTRITLFAESSRIDIKNTITDNFSSNLIWSFNFNLDNPDFHHEEVGAVLHARRADDGGDYATRQARYDWLTLNHFADITDGSDAYGITLSNADCYFMQIGFSTRSVLDTSTPHIGVLAGGKVANGNHGLPNQGGDNQFLQRFGLQTHTAYSPVAAMRFSLEHQNPLLAAAISGGTEYPETSYSLLTQSDPNILLWTLKPAEEGIDKGVLARLWNVSDATHSVSLSVSGFNLTAATQTTHIETQEAPIELTGGELISPMGPGNIRSFLLHVEPPPMDGSTPTPTATPLPTVTQTSSPTHTSTPSGTPTSTNTPLPTASSTATATSTPGSVPIPTPTPTLTPEPPSGVTLWKLY